MKKVIAIVGRPNVGKSTLFNRLVGRRQALVHDQPGVTRDRLFGTCRWENQEWWIVDTGGMLMGEDALSTEVTAQSRLAIDEANAVICLFDGREGLTSLDEEVATIVRRANVPVFYVVNKCEHTAGVDDFYRLGVEPLLPISAEHSEGIYDLCAAIAAACPSPSLGLLLEEAESAPPTVEERAARPLQIALLGRPNVGKSTLLNALAGEARVVAHDMPGTTRDVIDVAVERNGKQAILLDTAGIRRKARTESPLEKFSVIKSLQAIGRADVVVLLIDATEGVTHQDRSLAAEASSQGRPVVVGLNKWDRVAVPEDHHITKDKLEQDYIEGCRQVLGERQRVPVLCLSAKTKYGVDRLWNMIHRYGGAANRRLATSQLNRLLQKIQEAHHLPVFRGHQVKLYYMTQTGIHPPRITTFTNFPKAIPMAYRRYMLRHLEEAFEAEGLPIWLTFRKK